MTHSTNWPNPDRPGVPPAPFDQRPYLDHVLRRKSDNKLVDVRFFPRGGPGTGDWCFGNMNRMNEREAAERFYYHTPVLTPAQITEMLAAERERCVAALAEHGERAELGHNGSTGDEEKQYWRGALNTFETCCDEIRNLGAAP